MRVIKRAHTIVTCKCNAKLEVEKSDIQPGTHIGGRLTSIPSVVCPECRSSVTVVDAVGWGMVV